MDVLSPYASQRLSGSVNLHFFSERHGQILVGVSPHFVAAVWCLLMNAMAYLLWKVDVPGHPAK
jgi:hypothetical protein